MKFFLSILFVSAIFRYGHGQTGNQISNLQTFSKVYGYVKYFHPSDEASDIDWDKFAIYGAGEVIKCKNSEELLATLNLLFAPLAPSARFFPTSEKVSIDSSSLTPKNEEEYQLTFWQHQGVSFGMRNQWRGPYKSVRVNRMHSSAAIQDNEKKDTTSGQPIFETQPQPGEYIHKTIGNNLSCIISLSLYCQNDFTFPKVDPGLLEELQKAVNQVAISPASLELRLGNVINVWNVFQHFYPYWDVIEVDWQATLKTALIKCFSDQDYDDFLVTLQEFTAPLRDGHISIFGGTPKGYVPPVYWEWIEDQLVITHVFEENTGLKKGDIIRFVNEMPARKYFEQFEKRISAGTDGWRDYRAQSMTLMGGEHSEIELTTKDKTIRLKRTKHFFQDIFPLLGGNLRPAHLWIEEDIIYLNLDKITMGSIDSLMPQLQKTKAIICDLRGYPKGNHDFISHLLSQPDTTSAWMQVPRIIYPDQEKVVGFSKHNWMLPALEPHLDAKIIFITDGSAISYAESYLGYIEGYNLALIIGQPTAGTNGNINPFQLPGKFNVSWTGMKVLKHDGSRHHGIGILPDIRVEKTIKGILEGRDEFLEKAIELAKQ